jgi:hypothetical protein
MPPPSKAIMTRSGSVKPSVTARMGRLQGAHHALDVAAEVALRGLGGGAAAAEHEQAHALLLLDQGLFQFAVALADIGGRRRRRGWRARAGG